MSAQANLLKHRRLALPLLALLALLAGSLQLASPARHAGPGTQAGQVAHPDLGSLPLAFEPNAGQAGPSARFVAHSAGANIYFTQPGVVVSRGPGIRSASGSVSDPRSPIPDPRPPTPIHIQFIGANPSASISSSAPLPGRVNYFRGNDPAQWLTGLPTYATISYSNLYPGIALSYSGRAGQLKGTYTLAPNADPAHIRWRYDGATGLRVDAAGNLLIEVPSTEYRVLLTEEAPLAWQEAGGRRVPVSVSYSIAGDGSVGFVLGAYDQALPLVIDPTLAYSTYLGGSGADVGNGIAVDAAGNIYVVGTTESTNFPLSNPHQPVLRGASDIFVTRLAPDGSAPVYSTYLGGTELYYERGNAIAVDAAGNAYITGDASSLNFPLRNAVQPNYGGGGSEAFVIKLNPAGGLVYSTFLGGENVDSGYGIAVDGSGNAYVAGSTNSARFPTINAFQPYNMGGGNDAFVTKVNAAGTSWVYSTFLGGSPVGGYGGYDGANSIAVDAAGSAYIAGGTSSENFPVRNAFQPTVGGGQFGDAFVTKFISSGSALDYSTYLGGAGGEFATGIGLDVSGSAYVTGRTDSFDFPLLNPILPTRGGEFDAFVTRFTPAGSALGYSTLLGGNGWDVGYGIAVSGGSAYVAGYTESTDFPLANPLQPARNGSYDLFVTQVNAAGNAWAFSTYLGGSDSYEHANAIAVDGAGNMYLTGRTATSDFPTRNPYQDTNRGITDAFVVKISPLSPTPTWTGTPPTDTPSRTRTPTGTPTRTYTPTATQPPGCGPSWSVVSHPPSGPLRGVAAISYDDAWATGPGATMHWDGTRWSYVVVPTQVGPLGKLSADASNDLWGLSADERRIGHWNGAAWTPVPYPTPYPQPSYQPSYTQLMGVAARAPDDAWVTGHWQSGSDYNPYIIYHITSGRWMDMGARTKQDRPEGATLFYGYLTDVATVGPGEVWAVGYQTCLGCSPWQVGGIAVHCTSIGCTNGSPAMDPDASARLYGVAVAGPEDVWAVGSYSGGTLIEHWTGNFWSRVPSPNIGSLSDVVAVAPNDVWTAGTGGMLHWDGVSWAQSSIPAGAAPVALAATGPSDVWAVGVLLLRYTEPQRFNDVPPSNPFFTYIQALACRGIISGYADGTFRPGNNTTRGQLAKIVVLAEGWPIYTPPTPTFRDVPATDPFYGYIETAYQHGIISGYNCGANCLEYRPGNLVTRGQLCKIVVLAEGWTIYTPPTPTFRDVPPTDPFYGYIETSYSHGIISGYNCGTGCLEFRPGNNATRGQICKIVYNAMTLP